MAISAASKHFESSGTSRKFQLPYFIDSNCDILRICIFCRYTRYGIIASAGFSDPIKDPTEDELKIWMTETNNPPKELDMMQARYLLEQVADEFCDLYSQEQMAKSVHLSEGIYCLIDILKLKVAAH